MIYHQNGPPDVTSLPAPPQWATWIWGRTPNFKPHNSLGQAKSALGYRVRGTGTSEGYLYENVDGVWVLRHTVPRGTDKSKHPLWTEPVKRGRPVSDKAVDKAIASILDTAKGGGSIAP